MANLTETNTWTLGIYQIERTDFWDAGIGGAGIANLQAKQLASRTNFLLAEIDKIKNRQHYQIVWAAQTIANNSVKNAKGTTWNFLFPLTDWDYATPNDGITRDYIVTLGFTVGANWTYSSSASVTLQLNRTTAGPTLVTVASCTTFQPGMTTMIQKRVTLPPNEKVLGVFNVGNVGASVNILDAYFRIEEVIKP